MHRAQGSGSIGSGFRSHEIAVLGVQGSLEQGSRVQGRALFKKVQRFKGSGPGSRVNRQASNFKGQGLRVQVQVSEVRVQE